MRCGGRPKAATRVDAVVSIVSQDNLGLRHLNLGYPMEKVEDLFYAAGVGVTRNSDQVSVRPMVKMNDGAPHLLENACSPRRRCTTPERKDHNVLSHSAPSPGRVPHEIAVGDNPLRAITFFGRVLSGRTGRNEGNKGDGTCE